MKCVGGACGHAQAARDGSCKAICLIFYISGGGFHIGCLESNTGSLLKVLRIVGPERVIQNTSIDSWSKRFMTHPAMT